MMQFIKVSNHTGIPLLFFAGFGNSVNERLEHFCHALLPGVRHTTHVYIRNLTKSLLPDLQRYIARELLNTDSKKKNIEIVVPSRLVFIFPDSHLTPDILAFLYPYALCVPISSQDRACANDHFCVRQLLSVLFPPLMQMLKSPLDAVDPRRLPFHNVKIKGRHDNLFNLYLKKIADYEANAPCFPEKFGNLKKVNNGFVDARSWPFVKDYVAHGPQRIQKITDTSPSDTEIACFLGGTYRFGFYIRQGEHYDVTLKKGNYNVFCCNENGHVQIPVKSHLNIYPNDTLRD